MKLFTIGDSISQGFMSGAGARTDLCYSSLLARCMGLQVGFGPNADYKIAHWEKGGMPVNLEKLLRKLKRYYGSDIFGPIEWPAAALTVMNFLDDVEDYYERGPGAPHAADRLGAPHYNNIACWGFNAGDAWMVTPALCRRVIDRAGADDDSFATASEAFYRNALAVLNPQRDPEFDGYSAIDWLAHHGREEGVENLILWLGANNALGTVLHMSMQRTPGDPETQSVLEDSQEMRTKEYNLWMPADFEQEYEALLDRVEEAMSGNKATDWKVFVGTVPPVTIAPIAKGVGASELRDDPFSDTDPKRQVHYFRYYTYVLFDEDFARKNPLKITLEQAYEIDTYIAAYNRFIKAEVARRNSELGTDRFHVVDIAEGLMQLAFKRNGGRPTYVFPDYFDTVAPKPNTKFYHATTRTPTVEQGGIFSLDGVHPTAIGQGLVAWEFQKVMETCGVTFTQPLDWPSIFATDDLWQRPLTIMPELYQHDDLARLFVTLTQRKKKQ